MKRIEVQGKTKQARSKNKNPSGQKSGEAQRSGWGARTKQEAAREPKGGLHGEAEGE